MLPRGLLALYRLALRAWPRDARDAWGEELTATFARLWEIEGGRRGLAGRTGLIARGLLDAVSSGLAERARRRSKRWRPAKSGRKDVMGTIWMDVRYALRMLIRRPLFALAAIITLGLGIGANTAIFSMVYGLLFRPMPYVEPDRLILVWSTNPERGWTRTDISPADAWDWRARAASLADLGVIGRGSANLTGVDRPERLNTKIVTANVLSIFGATPEIGRDFAESDARPGAPATALLSWGFWQRRFGGERDVIGSTIELDGEAVTVIGVLPATFEFPDERPDLYVPMRQDPTTFSRTHHSYNAIARLAPGARLEHASREVARVSEELARAYPETNEGWESYAVRLRDDVVGDLGRQAAVVLMGAVAFVLLMACVNVANLLLARGNGRRRELAVRAALGAGRRRVTAMLLTETALLAVAGGVLGVLIAVAGTRAIAAGLPSNIPPVFAFEVDGAVLMFAVAVSLIATLLAGLLPALRGATAADAELRGRGVAGARGAKRFGGKLVIAQTALAVVLLAGGGIMMRSLAALQRQDLGYEPAAVLTMRVTPSPATYADGAALGRFYDGALEQLRALPGVEAAGTIQSLPLRGSNNSNSYVVDGEQTATDGYPARMGYLSAGYLEAMRVEVVRGRGIAATDRAETPRVALINEALARQRFGETDPVGRALRFDDEVWTIVGVVADMLERSVSRPPEPSIYVPVTQSPTRSRTFVIRTTGDPLALADAAQQALTAVDPDMPAYEVQTMNTLIDMRVSPFRLIAGLMFVFAVISLVLGAVGIYGVTAYALGRRTSEIGVRLAVGANGVEVVRMLVREGLVRGLIGLGIGLPLGLGLARVLTGLLVGVSPNDPITFVSVLAVLAMVSFLAAWLPARRAAVLDPVRALAAD
ncbi:MAG: ABC transporter permease [Gemmatimonadetes bacterium]|nr:ABC transporter permease [Gemmatimonadota bacterium]